MRTGRSIMKRMLAAASILLIALGFAGCSAETSGGMSREGDSRKKADLEIVSGSENREIEYLVQEFAKKNRKTIHMIYKGSLDIMNEIGIADTPYDAVWSANSIWLDMSPGKQRIKYSESICTNPVVFGIKESKASELGFTGRKVSLNDILNAVMENKLKFTMTSATQSNSGTSAYLAFMSVFSGKSDALSMEDLQKPELKTKIKKLLSGIERSSGSSDFLKDLFLKGNYDAMVNYETLLIAANKELIAEGREPLYLVYPYDGISLADSPFAYIDKGDKLKEELFKQLQAYLLSKEVQDKIQATGRRTGFGASIAGADKTVFNPDWGISGSTVLSPIKYPAPEVIREALRLYQSELRKPSYTVFCLDYSGSMGSNGGNSQLISTMKYLLDSDKASTDFMQFSKDDMIVVIPFNNEVNEVWKADNGIATSDLISNIENMEPGGGTNVYLPVEKGLDILSEVDRSIYTVSIVLMTDGQSNSGSIEELRNVYRKLSLDIPVYSITFGDADTSQLSKITELTNGNVFDGKKDLIGAFKKVRGYN